MTTARRGGSYLALCGGVGGAKLAYGLSRALKPEALTIAVNTGDDFEHLGLKICPDLDSVMYTLAGKDNPKTGWGRNGETWQFMSALKELGGEDWFQLGDLDLATHVERTRRLASGKPLSNVTRHLCTQLGVRHRVVPMSDHAVQTYVVTDEEELTFQEYFVREQWEPQVQRFKLKGIQSAKLQVDIDSALRAPQLIGVIICPSNPFVSIDPILAVDGLRRRLKEASVPVVAVSPIVAGQALRGPAAKMMLELGLESSPGAVAEHYKGLIDGFVMDTLDSDKVAAVAATGVEVRVTQTVMTDDRARVALARDVIEFMDGL